MTATESDTPNRLTLIDWLRNEGYRIQGDPLLSSVKELRDHAAWLLQESKRLHDELNELTAANTALAEAREKVKELTMSRDLLQARVNTISQVSQQLSLAEKVVKLQDLLDEANLTIARLRAPNIIGG